MAPQRDVLVVLRENEDQVDDMRTKTMNPGATSLVQQLPPAAPGCSRLYLCRHGETEFNRLQLFQGRGVNATLNDTGIAQATHLAQAMRNAPLRAIYSSTLKRASETASIVSRLHPTLELQTFEDLEEMSFGVYEGQKHDTCMHKVEAIHHLWDEGNLNARFPDGECPLDVVARGVAKIDAIMRSTGPSDHVLIVAHGRFNKVVLAQLLHGNLDHMHDLTQENTCVNVLDYDHGAQTYRAVGINLTNHLHPDRCATQ